MNGSRLVLAAFFMIAGTCHFISPATFLPLIPDYLPFPQALVFLSGAAEIIGGVGVLVPKWRYLAGWWLIALLVAVFPANLNMLMNDVPIGGRHVPQWILWARLPLQPVMIVWVWFTTLSTHRGILTRSLGTSHGRTAPITSRRR